MHRLVDPATLRDAREIFGPRVFVPLLQLRKRHLIGRIAVNLVRAQKYESLNPIRRDDEHVAKAISSLPLGMN
jgi:hypothetical protein